MDTEREPLLKLPSKRTTSDFQIGLLAFTRIFDTMSFLVIFPYVAQMIHDTGVASAKVGFYSGLIESFFSLVIVAVLPFWGRLSDSRGRKPILVLSLAGLALFTALFGFAQNIWQMLVLRGLAGLFAGSNITLRVMTGESAAPEDQARAYSWFTCGTQVAVFLGPLLGGALARPADRWPLFARMAVFVEFPYLLPGLVVGTLTLLAALLNIVWLKETKPVVAGQAPQPQMSTRSLLAVPGVLAALALYVFAWTLAQGFAAGKTIFYFLPVDAGGAALLPQQISYPLSWNGLLLMLWSLLIFPPLNRRFGSRTLFRSTAYVWAVVFLLYPLINLLLRAGGSTGVFWALVLGVEALASSLTTSLISVQLILNSVSPSASAVGALNGLASAGAAAGRAFMPAVTTSLFSLSAERHLAYGYLGWAFLFLSAMALAVSSRWLPYEHDGKLNRNYRSAGEEEE